VLFRADAVLLVMRLDFTSIRLAKELLIFFDELQVEPQRVELVVGRYGRPKELQLAEVERTLGRKARFFIPDDCRRVNRANNRGIPVVLDKPRSTISRRLLNICQQVNGATNRSGQP
jgi:Flp pilus assembly CpaE family ATPase